MQFGAFWRHFTQIYPPYICHSGEQNLHCQTPTGALPLDLTWDFQIPFVRPLECPLCKILSMPLSVIHDVLKNLLVVMLNLQGGPKNWHHFCTP